LIIFNSREKNEVEHLLGELKIWHDPVYEDKINLDCGAAYGEHLACLRLDDMQEFYV
jgi:hypothetical protein